MNCDKAEKLILLADAGELGENEAGDLREHLACCGRCSAYQGELDGVRIGVDSFEPGWNEPSREAVVEVIAEARASVPARIIPFPRARGLAVAACAAIALIVAGIWYPNASGRLADSEAGDISMLLEVVGESEMPDADYESALEELADRLLVMEGMDFSDGLEEALLTPQPEEGSPTALQFHSNPWLPGRRCA